MNALLAALNGHDRDPLLDEGGLQKLANYWETVRTYYAPFESELRSGTAQVYHHEIPGGQYSNYKPQVEGFGLGDRWEECKEMYRKVNDMFGDIIKVTPRRPKLLVTWRYLWCKTICSQRMSTNADMNLPSHRAWWISLRE